MEQTQFSTTIQGSQLQIFTKDSNHLSLHAQNLDDNHQFHLELDNVLITQITNSLFTDVQSMAQALKDAANNISSDSQLSLDNKGRLTYSIRTPQQEFSFSFDLLKEEIPVIESAISTQRQVETLEKELEKMKLQYNDMKSEYEDKIARLEQTISREQEENRRIKAEYEEKLHRIIQQKDFKPEPTKIQLAQGQICFRRDTPSANHCEFSDNDKSAKLIVWEKSESFLLCSSQVPDTGKHTFTLKVNQISGFIGFGITTNESGEFYYGDKGCYCYLIKDGRLITKDLQSTDKIEGAGEKDSIVEMTVDLDVRALVFSVDGKQVRSCKLKMEDDYTVFVGFGGLGDSITLL